MATQRKTTTAPIKAPEGTRLFPYKVPASVDLPTITDRKGNDTGKAWAVRFTAPDRATLDANIAAALKAGTLNHVLRRSGYEAEDGTQVPPTYEDGIKVTTHRVCVAMAGGADVWFDQQTGQATAALFVVPREDQPQRPPRRKGATSTDIAKSGPSTTTTVSDDVRTVANVLGLSAAQTQALNALVSGGMAMADALAKVQS